MTRAHVRDLNGRHIAVGSRVKFVRGGKLYADALVVGTKPDGQIIANWCPDGPAGNDVIVQFVMQPGMVVTTGEAAP